MTVSRRLSKPQRRVQLLDVASEIVCDEGTDALTLQVLAERAGVTKPVAYEHFGTREGALIALYRRLDADQMTAATQAMENAPNTAQAVCEIISASYVDCCVKAGPAFGAIAAALEGSGAMRAVKEEARAMYLAAILKELKPFTDLPAKELRTLILGFLGAADALGAEAAARRVPRKQAVSVLARLLLCGLAGER